MLPTQTTMHSREIEHASSQIRYAECRNQESIWTTSRIPLGGSRAEPGGLLSGRGWLYCCLGVIALVSIHDAVLIVTNHEIINEVEQNPLGTWLLQLQGGQVWLFVGVKLFGTSVVTTSLVLLYEFRSHLGLTVATVLSMLQCSLLVYLTFF